MKIIDDAIPAHLLRSVAATWPEPYWRGWHHYGDASSVKRATRDAEIIPRAAWPCLHAMAGLVTHAIGFPDWDLHGAGLHEIPPGGHLGRHLDSDVMPGTGWRRELSLVLFANERWDEKWNGSLILDRIEILPKFNRLVVFETTDDSWHSVDGVAGPDPRRTLALFYWSKSETAAKRPRALFASE